jgi:hypothetical protein
MAMSVLMSFDRKNFLVQMEEYQKRIYCYVGDDCEIVIRPELDERVHPRILVV